MRNREIKGFRMDSRAFCLHFCSMAVWLAPLGICNIIGCQWTLYIRKHILVFPIRQQNGWRSFGKIASLDQMGVLAYWTKTLLRTCVITPRSLPELLLLHHPFVISIYPQNSLGTYSTLTRPLNSQSLIQIQLLSL